MISDCRSEIKIADAIVDKDDVKLSQMTLDIELEQRFQNVAQVDRRVHYSWCSLSNKWRLRKIEGRKQVTEEGESFRGRPHRDVDMTSPFNSWRGWNVELHQEGQNSWIKTQSRLCLYPVEIKTQNQ